MSIHRSHYTVYPTRPHCTTALLFFFFFIVFIRFFFSPMFHHLQYKRLRKFYVERPFLLAGLRFVQKFG